MEPLTRLPAALRAWRDWLEWFDDDIAAALGALLIAIDPLLGAPGPRLAADAHEPDGIDGLNRRGNYERLLVSEWALADAMPDEFLRRAAGGEHLFLAPRVRTPRVDRELVALFDAGPDQLGAPRLVHIALWILLARRAARAGARFSWGVLQAPGEIHDGASPAMLRQLLEARTFERASDSHRQGWRTHLGASTSELWSIGAQADLDATHAVTVRRCFDGDIDFAIATRSAQRRATLRTPRDAVAAKLLQGRFDRTAAPAATARGPWRFSRQQAPLFSWRGNHVAAQLVGTDTAYVLHVSGNAHKRRAPLRVDYSSIGRLVAATVSEKRYSGVVTLGDEIGLWNGGLVRRSPRPDDAALRLVPGKAELLWCERFAGIAVSYVLLDDDRHLVRWREAATGTQFDPIAPHVIGAVRAGQERLVYVTFHERTADVHYWKDSGHTRHVAQLVRVESRTRPLRCALAGVRQRSAWHGAVAIEWQSRVGDEGHRHWTLALVRTDAGSVTTWRVSTDALWDIHDDDASPHVRIDANWEIVGPVRSAREHAVDGFGLLAIDPKAHRLVVAGTGPYAELYAADGEISAVRVSADGSRIALIDSSRQLVVLAHDGRVLLRTSHHDACDD